MSAVLSKDNIPNPFAELTAGAGEGDDSEEEEQGGSGGGRQALNVSDMCVRAQVSMLCRDSAS